VRGTRTFLDLTGLTYAELEDQLRTVAKDVGATRALGVSMGAGTVLRALDLFERVVLVLPASIDRPREDVGPFERLAAAIEAGEPTDLAAALRDTQPEQVRQRADLVEWSEHRALELAGSDPAMLRAIVQQQPIADRAVLGSYEGEALVIAQESDRLHPVTAAAELASLLPRARLETFPPGGLLWSHRARLRAVVSGFLNAD
jgi:pimeloyl-ACP methyl ester carboxylesterase